MKTGTGVLTTYRISGREFGSYVLCDSIFTARNLIKLRNIDERIESEIQQVSVIPDYQELDDVEFALRLPEVLHTASFLGYLVLRAKTMTVEEVLGDEGVIHELTHIMTKTVPVSQDSLREVRDKLRIMQIRSVGLFNQPL